MLPYFWYLLKVIICSGILFGYYWLFLRNKIFHQYNRFYLLAAMGLSLLLPLLKINFWQQGAENNQAIRVLRAVSVGDEYMSNVVITANSSSWNFQNMYPLVYWIVSLVFLFVLVRTLFIIHTLLKKYPVLQIEEVTFVNTSDDSTPFSFFKYIFWNSSIDMSTVTGKQIFKHEVAHIQEKHTYDKLFVNIILIFCWCNPFFWLYRKELNMIHEFIADKKAVEDSDSAAFAAMILHTTYPKQRFELTNNFFYSPIKRRLRMLTKIDNPRVSYFVRVMALPLVVLVFAAFTFKANTNASIYHGKKITVVIDAGHGGKDLGAKSINGIYEKDFTLAIAKKVKELNDNSDIEIILTRDEDSYSHVKEKADFTKEKNADLFISIHIDNTPVPNTKTGIHFYVARDQYENAEQSKLLASALIGEFTANYPLPVAKSPMQREGGIWTLQASNIPSVLIEAGYLSNNRDLTYLKTNEAKETIAKNVLAAIEKFANSQLQENNFRNNISISDTVPKNIFINTKHSDTNYTKSNDFKNKALVIVDSKEIGNVGINYIDQSNEKFSTAVVYNRVEAQKIYGPKGKYGVIKLTKRDAVFVTADSVFFDEKTRSIKLSGSDINLKGDFSDALIYLENKIITADQLNAIDPGKIDHINILKGDKLNDVTDAKGKKSVIYISLKANDLPGVTIKSKIQTQPLYVLDGVVKDKSFNLDEVNKNDILSIDVLKGYAAIKQYGDKGEDGVIIIKTKNPNRANSFSTVQIADIEAEKTLQQKKLAEQENKVKLDLEARTVKGEKISDDEMAALKLKLASIEQQKKAEVDLVERNVQGRKMTDQELATLKQNLQLEQLSKVKADDLAVRNVQGRKMTDKELATLKQNLQLAQQNKTKVNDLAEITVEGKKLSDQQIQELKQRKLLLEQQAKAEQGNKIFIKMEVSPKFTGGDEAWRKYLQENLNANTPVDEGWKAGKYTVIVKFIVHTDGTVTDVTTENYKGSKTANECIRVIKNAPKWIPAIQNGRNVNAYKKQPITFLIEEAEEEKIKSEASNIYSVPLKVHLMTDDKVNTYNMVGNGTFTVKSGRLYYLNGKIISNPQNIPSSSVIAMESYDEASGQKYFGDKGKYGVLLLKTKS